MVDYQISEHFSLNDLTKTSQPFDNTTNVFAEQNLKSLAALLERIYSQIGPFVVTSGYRSSAVNDAVGGAEGSYHLQGMAADIKPLYESADSFFFKIVRSPIFSDVGELINEAAEQGVVHVSLPTAAKRSQAMYLMGGRSYRYTEDQLNAPTPQGGQLPMATIFTVVGAILLALILRMGKK